MRKNKVFIILNTLFVVAVVVSFYLYAKKTQNNPNGNFKLTQEQKISEELNNFVRKPYVAGQFYPVRKEELAGYISEYLNENQKQNNEELGKLRILIAPHAGIMYSGKTAAAGFKQLEGENFINIIILGINHNSYFTHAAVFNKGEWETPLGNVKVNEKLAYDLVNDKEILADTGGHDKEHSIELMLPFLQATLKDFSIVPITVNSPSEETLNVLAFKIANVFDEDTLLVVSTDLSHYPTHEDALKADDRTINAILSASEGNWVKAIEDNKNSGFPNFSTSACGHDPLKIALKIADILEIKNTKEFSRSDSFETTKDENRVVGYFSGGFYSKELKEISLGQEAKEEALVLARKILENNYSEQKEVIAETPLNKELRYPIGAFVTLYENDQLRGCVGRFEPDIPLYDVIKEVTVSSATEDPRFYPVEKDELKDINIEISFMTPPKLIQNWEEIKLGTDGVKIVLNGKTGTLLPQVAKDGKYNLETFLQLICQEKAGLDKFCYKNPKAKIYTYQVEIIEESKPEN